MASPDEFIAAAEYIVAKGNPNVLLCPRGTTPALDGYRNHPDESITPLIKGKTWAPVVVDPSHSVGHSEFVFSLALWHQLHTEQTDYVLNLILIRPKELVMIQSKQLHLMK